LGGVPAGKRRGERCRKDPRFWTFVALLDDVPGERVRWGQVGTVVES
jgi:hypothetical protein